MIINVRGTSGSGKTSLIRYFFKLCTGEPEVIHPEGAKKAKGYKCNYKGETVYVVGSYANVCGGCDTVSTQEEIENLIRDYDMKGHVLFEGLFISHIYGRYQRLALEDPDNMVFLMLSTPFETCIEHIKQRRRESGKSDELKPTVERNARRTYNSTYRIREKLTADNLTWHDLPLENRSKLFEDFLDQYYLDDI